MNKKIVFYTILLGTITGLLVKYFGQALQSGPQQTEQISSGMDENADKESQVINPVNPGIKPLIKRSASPSLAEPENIYIDDDLNWHELDAVRILGNGKLEVPAEMIGDNMVVFGDVLAPKNASKRQYKGRAHVQFEPSLMWPGGKIPFVISVEGELVRRIEEAIEQIKLHTAVEFIERTSEEDYVDFIDGDKNCYSHVGRIGGAQNVMLSPKCGTVEILHELVHTIGLYHEHMRPDRDDYLLINWANIDEKMWVQFKKLPAMAWGSNLGDLGEFDWNSIMLYDSMSFAKDTKIPSMLRKDGQLFYPQRQGLSPLDIERINQLYPADH